MMWSGEGSLNGNGRLKCCCPQHPLRMQAQSDICSHLEPSVLISTVLMMTMGPRDAFQWERLGFLGMSSDCTSLKWSFPWEMMKQRQARVKKPQGISDPCEIKTRIILSCNKNLKHLSNSNTSQGSAAMSTPMFYSQPTSIAGSTINNNKMSPSGKILQKYFSFIFFLEHINPTLNWWFVFLSFFF